ncbi:MAG: ester cyclase [Actinobacteria bacterium]|nr:MAG: ester cyclase [Actinomycetota bacterium]
MPAAFTESRSREGDRMKGSDQEANKAVIRRFVEEFQNQNRVDAIDELVSRDFVNHSGTVRDVPGMELATDFEGMKGIDRMWRQAFPKQRVTIRDMAAEADKVWTHKTFETVHEGEFMGIAPTGKTIAVDAIDIMRVKDGKIVEHWAVQDMWGLMRQLGAV